MAPLVFLLLVVAVAKGAAEMACKPATPEESAAASLVPRARLRKDLLCGYDREVQPRVGINISTSISVRTARVVHQTLDMRVMIGLNWTDQMLAWDPARYDDVRSIQLSSEDIWTPSIATISTLSWFREEEDDGAEQQQQGLWPSPCIVNSSGSVVCGAVADMGGSCFTSHLYWPHVEAACSAYIGVDYRLSPRHGLTFASNADQVELSGYVPDNEWVLTAVNRELWPDDDELFMHGLILKFRLHSRGVVVSNCLLGPAVVLTVLLLGSFCLPIKSNVRVGLCCCSLFGTVLTSSLLFESLEPYNGPNPIPVTFFTGLLILSAIAVLMSFLLHTVTPHTGKALTAPRWLYSFQTWLFNAPVGKLWLKIMLLAPPEQNFCQAIELMPALYMQRGEYPGPADNKGQGNEESPHAADGASVLQMGAAGPHRIWDFTASFLNRCMFCIFLFAFCILCLHLIIGISMYKGIQYYDY